MTIDNGKKIVAFRLLEFISTLTYVLYVFMAYFPKAFRKIISDTDLNILTGGITIIYLLILLWPMIMKYRYIYFSADAKGVTLRWYAVGLMTGESMSIEIPAERYAGYVITKKFLGLHSYLTLFQNVQNQRAGYNPVSITALSKDQRKKLINALNDYKSVG